MSDKQIHMIWSFYMNDNSRCELQDLAFYWAVAVDHYIQ